MCCASSRPLASIRFHFATNQEFEKKKGKYTKTVAHKQPQSSSRMEIAIVIQPSYSDTPARRPILLHKYVVSIWRGAAATVSESEGLGLVGLLAGWEGGGKGKLKIYLAQMVNSFRLGAIQHQEEIDGRPKPTQPLCAASSNWRDKFEFHFRFFLYNFLFVRVLQCLCLCYAHCNLTWSSLSKISLSLATA